MLLAAIRARRTRQQVSVPLYYSHSLCRPVIYSCRYSHTITNASIHVTAKQQQQQQQSICIQQQKYSWLGWRWTKVTLAQPVIDNSKETSTDINNGVLVEQVTTSSIETSNAIPNSSNNTYQQPRLLQTIQDALQAAFLPRNYPNSVTPEYASYSLWQFAHNITGSINGVLSMQCLLFAVGLGAGSIPMAAALNWIIKDGLGQLGGVLYAGVVGDRFDSDPKRHRIRAAILMQLAGALEIVSPLWPAGFLAIASTSNVAKNVAWLATGATRTQMQQTLACHDNLGDVTAKSGSQSTAAGLIGTGIGVLVCATTNSDLTITASIYTLLGIINLYTCYRSISVIRTRTLNATRFEMVTWPILAGYNHLEDSSRQLDILQAHTPTTLAEHEPFIGRPHSHFLSSLMVDAPLHHITRLLQETTTTTTRSMVTDIFTQKYLQQPEKYYITIREQQVWLWYASDAQDNDLLRGIYHTLLLRRILDTQRNDTTSTYSHDVLIRKAHTTLIDTFDNLVSQLTKCGWDTAHVFIGNPNYRIRIHLPS